MTMEREIDRGKWTPVAFWRTPFPYLSAVIWAVILGGILAWRAWG